MADDLTLFPEHTAGLDSLRIDDSVLVFHHDRIHFLRGTALSIWDAVDGRRNVEQVARAVATRHPGTADLVAEVERFLLDLKDNGFISFRTTPSEERGAVAPHVAWVLDDGLVTIADLMTGERRTLSATASEVWMLLHDNNALESLAARVRESYPDAGEDLEHDVDTLVSALVDTGYLLRLGD